MESNTSNVEGSVSLAESNDGDSSIEPLDDVRDIRTPLLPEIWRVILNYPNMKDLRASGFEIVNQSNFA